MGCYVKVESWLACFADMNDVTPERVRPQTGGFSSLRGEIHFYPSSPMRFIRVPTDDEPYHLDAVFYAHRKSCDTQALFGMPLFTPLLVSGYLYHKFNVVTPEAYQHLRSSFILESFAPRKGPGGALAALPRHTLCSTPQALGSNLTPSVPPPLPPPSYAQLQTSGPGEILLASVNSRANFCVACGKPTIAVEEGLNSYRRCARCLQ